MIDRSEGSLNYSELSDRIRVSYRKFTKGLRPNDEDDCVQECLLAFFQKGKGQTVDQAVIDFLRRTAGGRKGSKHYETRLALQRVRELPRHLHGDDRIPKRRIEINHLSSRHRRIIELFLDGHLLREIGDILGVSESRISQQYAEAVFLIRAHYEKKRKKRKAA